MIVTLATLFDLIKQSHEHKVSNCNLDFSL